MSLPELEVSWWVPLSVCQLISYYFIPSAFRNLDDWLTAGKILCNDSNKVIIQPANWTRVIFHLHFTKLSKSVLIPVSFEEKLPLHIFIVIRELEREPQNK